MKIRSVNAANTGKNSEIDALKAEKNRQVSTITALEIRHGKDESSIKQLCSRMLGSTQRNQCFLQYL